MGRYQNTITLLKFDHRLQIKLSDIHSWEIADQEEEQPISSNYPPRVMIKINKQDSHQYFPIKFIGSVSQLEFNLTLSSGKTFYDASNSCIRICNTHSSSKTPIFLDLTSQLRL